MIIPRKSKSRCPAVRAVNDFMRYTGLLPDAATVNEFISSVTTGEILATPESFAEFQGVKL